MSKPSLITFESSINTANQVLSNVNQKNPTIQVSGLSTKVSAPDLQKSFSEFGKITQLSLQLDGETALFNGIAVITFLNPESALNALNHFHHRVVDGKIIQVVSLTSSGPNAPTQFKIAGISLNSNQHSNQSPNDAINQMETMKLKSPTRALKSINQISFETKPINSIEKSTKHLSSIPQSQSIQFSSPPLITMRADLIQKPSNQKDIHSRLVKSKPYERKEKSNGNNKTSLNEVSRLESNQITFTIHQ